LCLVLAAPRLVGRGAVAERALLDQHQLHLDAVPEVEGQVGPRPAGAALAARGSRGLAGRRQGLAGVSRSAHPPARPAEARGATLYALPPRRSTRNEICRGVDCDRLVAGRAALSSFPFRALGRSPAKSAERKRRKAGSRRAARPATKLQQSTWPLISAAR